MIRKALGMLAAPPRARLEDRDPDVIRDLLPGMWLAATAWHRAEVGGLERLPADGPVLLVGNHSGGTSIPDTLIVTLAFNAFFGVERRFHPIAHDAVLSWPVIGPVLRKFGVLPASHDNARLALDAGAAVLVYPGGDRETFRPTWQTGRVDFGGRSGWVRLALDADVPVAPVVALGGQETGLFLGRAEGLATALRLDRLFRLTVLPVTVTAPWGFQVGGVAPYLPFPAKIRVRVLEPFRIRDRFGPDPDVDEVYDTVTAEMQSALDGLTLTRPLPVVG